MRKDLVIRQSVREKAPSTRPIGFIFTIGVVIAVEKVGLVNIELWR
jgi:hypothetical protein